MIFLFIRNFVNHQPIIDNQFMSLKFWFHWLLFGDNIVYPYWYLTSYLQALLFIWIGLRCNILRYLYILTPFLILISILLNRYSFIFTNNMIDTYYSRNSLFCALPCVLIGSFFRININKVMRNNNLIRYFIYISIFAYIEYLLLSTMNFHGSGADFNLMTYLLATSIFVLCIKYNTINKLPKDLNSKLVHLGNKYSGNIYFYHILILSIIDLLILNCHELIYLRNAEFVIIMCIILSLFFELFKIHIFHKIKYNIL